MEGDICLLWSNAWLLQSGRQSSGRRIKCLHEGVGLAAVSEDGALLYLADGEESVSETLISGMFPSEHICVGYW